MPFASIIGTGLPLCVATRSDAMRGLYACRYRTSVGVTSTRRRGFAPNGDAAKEAALMSIEHINPEGMHKNAAFSQGVIVPAGARVLVIGGQNAVDENG